MALIGSNDAADTSTDLDASEAIVLAPASPAPLSADLAAVRARADGYAAASKASNTRRAYDRAWNAFTAWLADQGRAPFPPSGESVADYVAHLAGEGLAPASVDLALAALASTYAAAGFPGLRKHPRVKAVREGFRRASGTAQRAAAPLVAPELRAVLAALPSTLAGARDRALLLVGFAAALRRSEIVALDVAHVRFVDEGAIVHLERSKVDQEGEGRDVAIPFGSAIELCPVRALRAWLALAGITAGPIFRSVGKAGRLSVERLSDRSVALIVKAAVERAEIDPAGFSGHSLRAGFATSAARAGVALPDLMRQTGHKKAETALRYVREADLFRRNAAAGLL